MHYFGTYGALVATVVVLAIATIMTLPWDRSSRTYSVAELSAHFAAERMESRARVSVRPGRGS